MVSDSHLDSPDYKPHGRLNDRLEIPTTNGQPLVLDRRSVKVLAREIAVHEDSVYGVGDICRLTKWSRTTVMKMIHERRIPAELIEGRWIITVKNWRITKNSYFPMDRYHRRLLEDKFRTLRTAARKAAKDPTPENLANLKEASY